jgi:hypothetical protein
LLSECAEYDLAFWMFRETEFDETAELADDYVEIADDDITI